MKLLLAALCCQALFAQSSAPQSDPSKESLAILEFGANQSWSFTSSQGTISPTVAVEVTPIEHWLEIEFGTTPSFSHHSTQWSTDLLFKKPWTLSKKAEVMFGAGPEWIHTRSGGVTTNSAGVEVALDFMFWPGGAKRRFGWYLEPAFDHDFGRGHENSVGISGGLLISIP